MTGPIEGRDLQRVLHDPALALPDRLVDLGAVHRAARTRQTRRVSVAAAAGVAVVALVGLAAVQPWQDNGIPQVPDASDVVSPSVSASAPTPSESRVAPVVAAPVVGVTAISDQEWWVLVGTNQRCPAGSCPLSLLRTGNGGASFHEVSRSAETDGIPPGTTTVRFLTQHVAWAIRPQAPAGEQLWFTGDGGKTWHVQWYQPQLRQVSTNAQILALEAGGGTGWLLLRDGKRIGVAELGPAIFENPGPVHWLGTDNGAPPALTVQNGDALVLWFEDSRSRTTRISSDQQTLLPANPCSRDLGVGSVSASTGQLAVSCSIGTADQPYVSDDGGRSWSKPGAALHASQRYTVGSIRVGWTAIGGQDGTITLSNPSSDDGSFAVKAEVANTEPWTYLGFTDPEHGFGITESGHLFRTTDGGASWNPVGGFAAHVSACCAVASPAGDKRAPVTTQPAACTGSDLKVIDAQGDGASGNLFVFVTVRNTSDRTCRLDGAPEIWSAGRPVPAGDGGLGSPYPFGAIRPADLVPGSGGHLQLVAQNQQCRDKAQLYVTYADLSLVLDDGAPLLLSTELRSCTGGLRASDWFQSNG